jgi:hypothetical protein
VTAELPMMKCGHRAQATDKSGKPICAICFGLTPDAEIVDEAPPDLTGREATCCCCRKATKSSPELPFFTYRENYSTDSYYCGCRGWD